MEPVQPHVVVHLSDLHFGRDDRRVLRAVYDAVWKLAPNVVTVSGDLTQRARRRQFLRARTFLDGLPRPHVIVPGNHDIPLFNVLARVFDPLGGYTKYITRDLQPIIVEGRLWVAGINTTRPLRWKSGGIAPETLARLHDSIQRCPAGALKVLVAHHPFETSDPLSESSEALTTLTSAGVDVFLTGHLHTSYTGHTAHRYNAGGRTAVVVEAGTATSTRRREEANAFNVLRLTADSIVVETHAYQQRTFASTHAQRFVKSADGWRPDTDPTS